MGKIEGIRKVKTGSGEVVGLLAVDATFVGRCKTSQENELELVDYECIVHKRDLYRGGTVFNKKRYCSWQESWKMGEPSPQKRKKTNLENGGLISSILATLYKPPRKEKDLGGGAFHCRPSPAQPPCRKKRGKENGRLNSCFQGHVSKLFKVSIRWLVGMGNEHFPSLKGKLMLWHVSQSACCFEGARLKNLRKAAYFTGNQENSKGRISLRSKM